MNRATDVFCDDTNPCMRGFDCNNHTEAYRQTAVQARVMRFLIKRFTLAEIGSIISLVLRYHPEGSQHESIPRNLRAGYERSRWSDE